MKGILAVSDVAPGVQGLCHARRLHHHRLFPHHGHGAPPRRLLLARAIMPL